MKDIPIIYDNNDILVINKPFGIAVQGGEGVTVTVIGILERQTGKKIYPVHRLDKDTAGLMIFALSADAASRYTRLIGSRSLVKTYQAVCFGSPQGTQGKILLPAGRSGQEKPGETSWKLLQSNGTHSLLSLGLGTGRMHQIRIHLAATGCPIIGDDKYGDFKKNREIRSSAGIRKLQLASVSLEFPLEKRTAQFQIPLPDHIATACKALGLTVQS
ncbi:MAG TPA: RluA family pseudouridine synthase [Treponemataceae bacterium]|jgi:23S rRNA pseudouridine955/2504/2580 synthase|nr:RluA family pseudouridine synthase [Treponemataceae bacterium]